MDCSHWYTSDVVSDIFLLQFGLVVSDQRGNYLDIPTCVSYANFVLTFDTYMKCHITSFFVTQVLL